MARKFVVSVDLNKNELLNARIQNISAAPSSPVAGQIYFNTTDHFLYFYDGTKWLRASGDFGAGGETTFIEFGTTKSDGTSTSVARADHTHGLPDILAGTALTVTEDGTSHNYTVKLNDTTVTTGSYGSATAVSTFTVDQQGRLTAAGTTNIQIPSSQITSFTEDVQDIVGGMVTAPNTESGISVTYDDTNGKLDFNVADPTITLSGDVNGSATMTNLGDVTITTTIQPNSVALGTDTTGNYVATISGTANEIEVSGSGSETAAVTIGLPDNVTVTGNLTIGGNLDVTGTINSVNTTQVNIVDNKINLNTNFTGTPTVDAGIRVERGDNPDVEILWRESTDEWTLTNNGTNYHAIVRKHSETLDASATTYVITHNLGTQDYIVQIYEVASPYAQIEADIEHTSTTQATLKFASAPSAGAYRVVITG